MKQERDLRLTIKEETYEYRENILCELLAQTILGRALGYRAEPVKQHPEKL